MKKARKTRTKHAYVPLDGVDLHEKGYGVNLIPPEITSVNPNLDAMETSTEKFVTTNIIIANLGEEEEEEDFRDS